MHPAEWKKITNNLPFDMSIPCYEIRNVGYGWQATEVKEEISYSNRNAKGAYIILIRPLKII